MNRPGAISIRAQLMGRVSAIVGAATVLAAGTMLPMISNVPVAYASATVNGGGSSFAVPIAGQWSADVAKNPYDVSINYVNGSSGAGRNFYAGGEYDYAATDVIYNPEDGTEATTVQTSHPFRYVTVTAGGLSFEYDLVIGGVPFTSLNLTRQDVCQIFTGETTNWSQLASTPGDGVLAGADLPIKPVVRSDPAGESYVLSQYCMAVDPTDWSTFRNWVDANAQNIGYSDPNMKAGQPVSYWPTTLDNGYAPLAASGAPSVAGDAYGANDNGNITYVATAYAVQLGAPVASVQNAAGDFVQPNANSVQRALAYATANSEGTFNLNFNGPDPGAYFPSTYSYITDPTTTHTPDAGINAPLNKFLCYAVGLGQWDAAPLRYAPLSKEVTALSVNAIEATLDAPPANQCGQGGPQPSVSTGSGGQVTITGNNGSAGSTGNASTNAGGSGNSNGTGTGAGSGGASAGTGSKAGAGAGAGVVTAAGASRTNLLGSSGGSSATIEPVSSPTGSGGSPGSDQAVWWVLGGFVIAAGATRLAGRADHG